jgi:hypothetical protein
MPKSSSTARGVWQVAGADGSKGYDPFLTSLG